MKWRGEVNGAGEIKSQTLRMHQYMEDCVKVLEIQTVEWEEDSAIEKMWKQVKQILVGSSGEAYVSVRMDRKNPKSEWRKDEDNGVVGVNEAT